ncbi:MAG: ParB/RepB/Spo0J family partition protein [Patescibacteria group bacterium]
MSKLTGLGRGLGSLIPKKIPHNIISEQNREIIMGDDSNQVLQVSVDSVEANPHQPRKVFDHEDLETLIESIKVHGIIQPLIVTKIDNGYQLIAGERRLRAAKILGLATVPVLVREADEQEKMELALIENVQRKNLNPIEKAVAYQRLIDEFNLSQEEAGQKLGISRSVVGNTIRFLELPEKVQEALGSGAITEGHAKIISGLEGVDKQLEFLNKILQHNFTVRDAAVEMQKTTRRRVVNRSIKDPMLEEKEDILRSRLNTKVLIKKKGGAGQIIVDFYSDEELEAIIGQMIK